MKNFVVATVWQRETATSYDYQQSISFTKAETEMEARRKATISLLKDSNSDGFKIYSQIVGLNEAAEKLIAENNQLRAAWDTMPALDLAKLPQSFVNRWIAWADKYLEDGDLMSAKSILNKMKDGE